MAMFPISRRAVLGGIVPLLLFAAAIVFAPSTHAAAPVPVTKGGSTRIVAEKMTYDSVKRQVLFEGGVHVTRPDMEIWSDRLTMEMEKNGKTSAKENVLGMEGGRVERIIAESNVRIQQEGKVGTCGKATYLVNEGKIIMEQNPVIVDGENRIRGRVINFFTTSGRSEVIGNVDVQFSTDKAKTPQLPGAPANSGEPAKVAQ